MDKNNEILEAVSEHLKATLDYFKNIDVYYYIAPYLFRGDIDAACPYFQDNRITLNQSIQYTSDELKSISYLAKMYRNKIAYSPKNIDYYLQAIGYVKFNESAIDILCFETLDCATHTGEITYQEWLLLDDDYRTHYEASNIKNTATIGEAIAYATT
ncbi:MAG: hypothetical protein ACWGHH_06460 [Sulfurovaceae bacterium]